MILTKWRCEAPSWTQAYSQALYSIYYIPQHSALKCHTVSDQDCLPSSFFFVFADGCLLVGCQADSFAVDGRRDFVALQRGVSN